MYTFAFLGQIGPLPIEACAEGQLCSIGKSVAGCARIVGDHYVVRLVVHNVGVVHVGRMTAIDPLKTYTQTVLNTPQ